MRKLLFFFVVVCLVACSSIDCPVDNTVSVQYEVCDKAGKAWALKDSLSVVTMRVNVDITALLNSENVTLNRLIGKSSFSLPMSYSHPEDVLFFCFTDTVKTVVDTVWIKKDDIPHFESVDCNAAFFHEITDVRHSRHYIDSLVLLNKTVNYDQTTVHFRLVPKNCN